MNAPIDRREVFRSAWPSYGPAWDAAVEAGVDMFQLERNLRLTPGERVAQHQDALEFAEMLRAAMRDAAVQR